MATSVPRSRPVQRPADTPWRVPHPSWGIAERPETPREALSAQEFWARLGI